MYQISESAPADVIQYTDNRLVKSIYFDYDRISYGITINGCKQSCRGLTSTLQYRFYPTYVRSTSKSGSSHRRRQKKGSSEQLGKIVDKHLTNYVKTQKRPKHKMTIAIINFIEQNMEHTIVGAQLPTYIKEFRCITQADLITIDKLNRLWMIEIKTGYPRGGYRKKGNGMLTNIPSKGQIPSTVYNHWQLQCHYTAKGLKECGLPLYNSCIVQAFNERKRGEPVKVTVKKLETPKWIKKYLIF